MPCFIGRAWHIMATLQQMADSKTTPHSKLWKRSRLWARKRLFAIVHTVHVCWSRTLWKRIRSLMSTAASGLPRAKSGTTGPATALTIRWHMSCPPQNYKPGHNCWNDFKATPSPIQCYCSCVGTGQPVANSRTNIEYGVRGIQLWGFLTTQWTTIG